MGSAREYWFKEAERWMKEYPELKRNLPSSPDLFNFHLFDRVEKVEQVLRDLENEEQQLLELFYRQQKSYIAVSIIMHMSEATVYRTKVRLLHKLATRFGIKNKESMERV